MNPNTNFSLIPNSPTRTNIKSPKVITPYLHQLPYISRITSSSPRTPRYKEDEVPNLSRDQSREVSQTKNISEAVSKSGLHKVLLSPKREAIESLKSPRARIPHNLKSKESNPLVSQVAKGDLMKVLPQMKLKTLKDKMLVLSKLHERREAERDSMINRFADENSSQRKREKASSITPMELQEGKSRPDFLENLQDCIFALKKNKLMEIEKPAESTMSFTRISFASPRGYNQQSSRVDQSVSQSQLDMKGTIGLKTPGHRPTKSKDFAVSTIKLKSELEISQETTFANVNESLFRGHHTRGHSWGQALGQALNQFQAEDTVPKSTKAHNTTITIQKPLEIMSARKPGKQNSCRSLLRSPSKDEGYSQTIFKPERQRTDNFQKTSGLNTPNESMSKLPVVFNNKLERSTTNFNLKLDDNSKKEDVPGPSTESRKNALLSTECGSTTKRRKSVEKNKIIEDEEFNIFNIVHFIKGSTPKKMLRPKNEQNSSMISMENQLQMSSVKRSMYMEKKDTIELKEEKVMKKDGKKHSRRSSQGF